MARYEKLEHEVDTSEAALRRALFEEKQAEAIIGELEGEAVGFALDLRTISPRSAASAGLYVEDIFVDEAYRDRGYGRRMLSHLAAIAAKRRCRRMEWIVLDWNAPSIAFYRSLGAVAMDEWTGFPTRRGRYTTAGNARPELRIRKIKHRTL